ncbi:aromatic acid exporter family protein [Auraticoccus sp. F435]|uniref:Aromatic acid exporter family protein n=1 Tax=Auraticoccus cholistanensis TaxID=2656650 RepID=A0A6A9UX38_9ACTN|nr:FUSC family protein [Auraticoccus cholistanensis]MVA76084.1 aromatic acid exporter family protein [Auraticoccus cholistanensis]
MGPPPLLRLTLRAFDASERTARRGTASLGRRARRLRFRAFMIAQCAVTAGLAYWVAGRVLGHPMPIFAPVAAIVCLGFSFGQRFSRAVEMAVGVALGVLVGDVFVRVFGSGPWQVVVVAGVAMSIATLVGARNLMVIQAGVQSTIVVTLLPAAGEGVSRWLDAVVGCALALLVTTVAPSAPLVRPRILVAEALTEVSGTVRAAREALATGDPGMAEEVLARARRSETQLSAIEEATREGMAVVRYSPFVRAHRPQMESIAALYEPLDRLMRNLRVMTRRTAVATFHSELPPPAYLELMDELVEVLDYMAGELYERRLPTAAQKRLVRLAQHSARTDLRTSLSNIVVLAQIRSMTVDLLQLCGLSYADARDLVPELA